MESSARPYQSVTPEVAEVLRPVLPGLADETIEAIAREVPDYAGAMEGEFGQVVRRGVEVAFTRFVDLLADPEPDAANSRQTYVNLGRGEFRAGRSLDALLAAYRVGARLAWRRFVAAGVAGGLSADALYALGEAIFAYIDELSAESAEGFAEEQSLAAGESDRRRRRLVRLLVQEPPPGDEAVRSAAAAAGWPLPRRLAALVLATGDAGAADEAQLDSLAARVARRLGEGAVGAEAGGDAVVLIPDPDAPGRRRRLEAAIGERTVALGPTVPWARAAASARRAAAAPSARRRRAAARARAAGRGGAPGRAAARGRPGARPRARGAQPRAPGRPAPRARASGCARRSTPGSTVPGRCRRWRRRSTCTRRRCATGSASCATCSATASRIPRRGSSWHSPCAPAEARPARLLPLSRGCAS